MWHLMHAYVIQRNSKRRNLCTPFTKISFLGLPCRLKTSGIATKLVIRRKTKRRFR